MTPGTSSPAKHRPRTKSRPAPGARIFTEVYSRAGTDPAKSLRQQLEEGLVIPGECAILTFFNLKRERDTYILFPSRAAAEDHLRDLIAAEAADTNRAAIRSVEEALA